MFKKTLLIFTLLMVSCQSRGDLDHPPKFRYGEDPCDECFMLINEAEFAAASISDDGQTRRFDDIGCMLIYHKKHQNNVAHFWVTDFNTQEWLEARNAFFVVNDSIQTPMGFGIIAAENEKEVQNITPSDDPILKFPQLLEKTEELYY